MQSLKGTGPALKLEMKAGVIPVSAVGDRWTLSANAPTFRDCTLARSGIAAMLGLAEQDVFQDDTHATRWVNTVAAPEAAVKSGKLWRA